MLTIRDEQLRALGEASLLSRVQARMQELFPQHCAALGGAGTAVLVRESARRARALGLAEAEVQPFVALEFAFGPEFYRERSYAWADAILREAPQPQRMDRLRKAAVSYLEALDGAAGHAEAANA